MRTVQFQRIKVNGSLLNLKKEYLVKKILFICFLLSSQMAFSAKWSDIQISSKVKLKQDLVIKTKSDKKISFTKKLNGFIEDISHLSNINVELYKVRFKSCSAGKEVSDLFLHEIAQTAKEPVVIGVELKKGCLLEIYVEFKDLESKSLFSQK